MNYYMNVAALYDKSDLGRRLYQEIGLIEEEHVSQYGSLIDTNPTWLEGLLVHEYTECYLYYSCMMTECDDYIRRIWEQCLVQEIAHLHKAKELLFKYEHKDWMQVLPCGTFPELLHLRSNIDYVRELIRTTSGNTEKEECVVPLLSLNSDDRFFTFQNKMNHNVNSVASHNVIDRYIRSKGQDYRYETAPNPVSVLRNRKCDNTSFARVQSETPADTQICGTTKNNCRCATRTDMGITTF